MQLIAADEGKTRPSGDGLEPSVTTSTVPATYRAIDPAKAADIKKLLDLVGSKQFMRQVMDQMIVTMKKAHPEADDALWADIANDDSLQAFVDRVVPIYDKYYTHQEIKDLIAFYQSPVGQKSVRVSATMRDEWWGAELGWAQDAAGKAVSKGNLATSRAASQPGSADAP
jgi:hypothetical protein